MRARAWIVLGVGAAMSALGVGACSVDGGGTGTGPDASAPDAAQDAGEEPNVMEDVAMDITVDVAMDAATKDVMGEAQRAVQPFAETCKKASVRCTEQSCGACAAAGGAHRGTARDATGRIFVRFTPDFPAVTIAWRIARLITRGLARAHAALCARAPLLRIDVPSAQASAPTRWGRGACSCPSGDARPALLPQVARRPPRVRDPAANRLRTFSFAPATSTATSRTRGAMPSYHIGCTAAHSTNKS